MVYGVRGTAGGCKWWVQWSSLYFTILNSTTTCRFTHPSIAPPGPVLAFSFQSFRLGPADDQSRGRVVSRPKIPGRKSPRDSGSPSGGMTGILDQTHSETSHRERGQGGPRGELADRYGDRGASEACGLEVARERGQFPVLPRSRGPMALLLTFPSLLISPRFLIRTLSPPEGRLPGNGYKFRRRTRWSRLSSFFPFHLSLVCWHIPPIYLASAFLY